MYLSARSTHLSSGCHGVYQAATAALSARCNRWRVSSNETNTFEIVSGDKRFCRLMIIEKKERKRRTLQEEIAK